MSTQQTAYYSDSELILKRGKSNFWAVKEDSPARWVSDVKRAQTNLYGSSKNATQSLSQQTESAIYSRSFPSIPVMPAHQSTPLDLHPLNSENNQALLELVESWQEEGDEQEQTETWNYLRQALDENRLSNRPLFS
jgi:hypothetical protein